MKMLYLEEFAEVPFARLLEGEDVVQLTRRLGGQVG